MRKATAIALAALILTGCSFERNGVVHHVIIGFGVVSVPVTNAVAQVSRINALGVYGGNLAGPACAVGYLSSTITTIQTNANLILEIK